MKFQCCTRDEGGPFGVGVQAQTSNHPALLGLRVQVVSSWETAQNMCQIRDRKMSTSELSITHRDVENNVKIGLVPLPQDKSNGYLITELDGVRCGDSMILFLALVRNVRTCRSDVKGNAQVIDTTRVKVPMPSTGTEQLVVAMKPVNAGGVKELCHSDFIFVSTNSLGGTL